MRTLNRQKTRGRGLAVKIAAWSLSLYCVLLYSIQPSFVYSACTGEYFVFGCEPYEHHARWHGQLGHIVNEELVHMNPVTIHSHYRETSRICFNRLCRDGSHHERHCCCVDFFRSPASARASFRDRIGFVEKAIPLSVLLPSFESDSLGAIGSLYRLKPDEFSHASIRLHLFLNVMLN